MPHKLLINKTGSHDQEMFTVYNTTSLLWSAIANW